MTDREMLELVAKAADEGIVFYGECLRSQTGREWNPLTDDGDALRLAVKLGITMYPAEGEHDGATATRAHPDSQWIVVDRTDDPCADMRRAITRAAAEIGKVMP